ncbi:TonB-dependent receptor family protein [Persicirhabdus sediminis]|uniref:TonB-dependent receptor n=1 Tax=Persicirhabdus sediminis TaxID=454144 RepID=A0A8J7SMC5_9BACT|nr:TonB-dependent receptor [Persicirhabdus sediminis]MBK1791013.1 TonB-dependent receptor [Persicirhabdus sediminis]
MKFSNTINTIIIANLAISNSFGESPTQQPEMLPETVIDAHDQDLVDSIEMLEERVENIPGGASLQNVNDIWLGRVVKPAEVFRYTPGVYANNGGTATDGRIAIRGSGATRRYGARGITLTLDGIPANVVDGSFYTRAYDPLATQYLNVYRGANGMPYGGLAPGGVIDFIQKNGINSAGGELLLEYGSFDTARAHLSYGEQIGNWDYFASYSYGRSNGYRANQNWQQSHLNANLGYLWSDDAQTRFYLHASDSNAQLASGLTEGDAQLDPIQSYNSEHENRDLNTFRIAQKTSWIAGDTQWQLGAYYQNLDFDHLTKRQPHNLIDYNTQEVGLSLSAEGSYQLAKIDNSWRLNSQLNYGKIDNDGSRAVYGGGPPRSEKQSLKDTVSNFQLYGENRAHLAEKWKLITGLGWQYGRRERKIKADNVYSRASEFDESYSDFTPRLGMIYQANEYAQVFTNLSQSYEIPPLSEAEDALEAAITRSFEIGSRWQSEITQAEIVYYYSLVDDDFVEYQNAQGSYTPENVDSKKQGLEASLTTNLSQLMNQQGGAQLLFDQLYLWNDFTFADGELDGKQLPGIPEHVITTRVRLQSADGKWQSAIGMQYIPQGLYVYNDNSRQSSGYAIFDLSAEYQLNENLSIYGGVDNLFDKNYVSSVTINPYGDSSDPAAYHPGDGRSVYLGMKMNW